MHHTPYVHLGHLDRTLKAIPRAGTRPTLILDGPSVNALGLLDRFLTEGMNTISLPYLIGYEPPSRRVRPNPFPHDINDVTHYRSARIAPLARSLASLIQYLHFCRSAHSEHLIYPPHLSLLIQLFHRHPISGCQLENPNTPLGDHLEAEIYNSFVQVVRQTMQEHRQRLRRARHGWGLSSQENAESLRRFLDGQFEKSESLTFIHLNLFPTKQLVALVRPDPTMHELFPTQDHLFLDGTDPTILKQHLDAVRAMRDRITDRPRKLPSLFEHRRGLIWSIMPSLQGGYYLHLTLCFDTAGLIRSGNLNGKLDTPLDMPHLPSAKRPIVTFPELIGQYLVKIATDGQGAYSICHHDGYRYGQEWAYGTVLATERLRRDALYQALGHIAQRRQLVRLQGEPKGKYFGMAWGEKRRPQRTHEAAHRAQELDVVRKKLGRKTLTR